MKEVDFEDVVFEKILNIEIDNKILIEKQEEKYNRKEERKIKKIDDGIKIQSKILEIDHKSWSILYSYYLENIKEYRISNTKLDILRKMSIRKLILPSEKQSKILYDLYIQAQQDGVEI